jgi:hypothetical protein
MSGFIYSTDQSANIFLLKTEFTPKAVARFVIIFNFQYDWMEKDELKVTSSENKQDVVTCYCITNGKISDKRYNKHLISII